MKDREIPKQYISLEEASKLGAYSQEYLSLRARQKKLQAVKIGRNWVTTKEWFYEYVGNAEEFKNNVKNGNGNHKHVEAPANLPIEDLFKERQILLQKSIPLMRLVMVSALVILTATGIALGKDGLAEAYQKANQKVQEFAAGFDKGIQDSFKTVSLRVEQFSEGFDAGLPLALRSVGNFTQEFSQGFDSGFPSAMRTLESGASQFAEGFDYGIRSPAAVERFVSDLPASISDAYFRANQFVEQRLKKDFNSLARGYENINNAAERSIAKSVSRMQDGVQEFKEGLAQGLKTFSFIKVPSAQKENVAVVPETVKEEKSIQGEQASSRTAEAVQRETVRTVVAVDNKELNELRSQVQGILIWKGDIDEFRRIASKLQSSPPSSYAVNAPVYIGSSGVQVAGSVSAGSVGAAFGGVKDLGVGLSATIGETNNSASKFTVNAESFFNSPVKLTSSFNVGTSALNNLTVDTSGNLETKGTVKVLNSSDVAQVTLDASGNITITGTLTAQGGSSISGGTTELSALSVTGNTILGNEAADTIQFGASTLALPNSLNIDSGTLYIDASNNRIGLGTASPARIMDLFGAGPQLRLSADSSNYTDISHASTGFFTINTTGFGIGLADGLSIGSSYISTTPPSDGLIVQGNTGIGTTAPDAALEINHATGDNLRLTYNDSNGSAVSYTDFATGSDGALTVTSTGLINLQGIGSVAVNDSGSDVDFRVEGVGAANALFVQGSDGFIGIGTATPARRLDVFGSGPQLRLSADSSNYTDLSHAGTGFFTIDTTGFGVGFADGVGIGSTYSTTTPPSDGLIVQGNTGIGTTSPNNRLEVLS
ncbi:MAG: hypothetical protein HYS60_01040, partial [Candidatus Wildermuthbacteria bacterium]|nr:hypothetical protein [Candidatus Wildermuthbacteria bacterium]